jgi:AcrR family transcriptional regulator
MANQDDTRDDAPDTGPKFRRRAEARPDEILDAALELFSENGFDGTRMEDVARRAGLSKGAVYLYFPSKKALLEGLVRRAVVPVADSVLGGLKDYRGDPRPVISRILLTLGARLAEPGVAAVPKIILREAMSAPEIAEMYRREVLDRAIPAVTALIAQGVEGGHIRPVDPEMTVRSIVGPVLVHVILSEVFDIRPAEGFAIERLIRNHVDILSRGLAPEGGA